MEIAREKLPKYMIPLFNSWVALCNIVIIVWASILFSSDETAMGEDPALTYGVVMGINILSILLLYPMFTMDPIKPFFKGALIWYIVVTVIYIVFEQYLFLIPGTIQLAADMWFHWKLKKISST